MQIRQSSNWYDVLAFLSLAAGLGLACGIALGGIALLLASPAYGAPAPEVEEGALFLRARQRAADSGGVAPIQAALVSTDVQFRVSGPIARARVVQIFHIGPSDTVVIEIEYQQCLQHDDNLFSPRFPMVVAPRHIRTGPL